jgi:hypothetical protein
MARGMVRGERYWAAGHPVSSICVVPGAFGIPRSESEHVDSRAKTPRDDAHRPQSRQTPSACVDAMAPIITVDTATSPAYIDAHHSTQGLTTWLHNDQLILVEVQGTFEYNITNGDEPVHVRLGDITWDETVYSTLLHVLTPG